MANLTKQFVGFVIASVFLAAGPALASEITGELSNQGLVPIAPSNVLASKTGDAQITITWSAVAGVDGYKIYRKKDGGNFELVSGNITPLSYVDSNLSDGLYSYQVQSFLGTLSPNLNDILPTTPVSIVTPAPAPTGSGGGGGGGGGGGATTPSVPASPLSPAAQKVDANKDNKIDVLDFNVLMVHWGSASANNAADFSGDGKVDVLDFNLLMINWTL